MIKGDTVTSLVPIQTNHVMYSTIPAGSYGTVIEVGLSYVRVEWYRNEGENFNLLTWVPPEILSLESSPTPSYTELFL